MDAACPSNPSDGTCSAAPIAGSLAFPHRLGSFRSKQRRAEPSTNRSAPHVPPAAPRSAGTPTRRAPVPAGTPAPRAPEPSPPPAGGPWPTPPGSAFSLPDLSALRRHCWLVCLSVCLVSPSAVRLLHNHVPPAASISRARGSSMREEDVLSSWARTPAIEATG